MTTNERAQRMAERILEDETLRGDLEDDAATALVDWASAKAAAAAADSARTDAVVEAQVQAIRQAARAAGLSGETEPKRLIALAAAALAPTPEVAKIEPPTAPTNAPASPTPAAVIGATTVEKATPSASAPPVADASASVAKAIPAPSPTPPASIVAPPSDSLPKPAQPSGPRPRRKRSRLARFFKHLLGGR